MRILLFAFSLAAFAQTDPRLCSSIRRDLATANEAAIRAKLDFTSSNIGCLAALAEPIGVSFRDLIQRIEKLRMDKQAGAGSTSAGGTDLVAKGISAKTLSIAAEHGALTQSVNGQVVTFRGNLAGLPTALVNKELFPYCDPRLPKKGFCVDQSVLGWMRRVSFAVSFDASRNTQSVTAQPAAGATGAAVPANFTARGREVSMVGAKVELWNKRDISSPKYVEAWAAKIATSSVPATARAITERYEALSKALDDSTVFTKWKADAPARIAGAANRESAVVEEIERLLNEMVAAHEIQREELAALSLLIRRFYFTQDEVISIAGSTPVLSFEYTNNRPLAQSHTSTFRGILELPSWYKWSLTVNGAVTIFDTPPPTITDRLRDSQFGVQMERPLGDIAALGTASISGAFYYQRQNVPAALTVDPANPVPGVSFINFPATAQTVFAEKGNIRVGQLRLTLGSGGSVRYPISLTYSSRTELINKPAWRAQVGVSYDFDSLFARK